MNWPPISRITFTITRNITGPRPCIQHRRGELLRDLFVGQHVLQDQRVGDDEHQRHGQFTRLKQRVLGVAVEERGDQGHRLLQQRQVLFTFGTAERPHVAIDKTGNQEGIDSSHGRGLGRGKDRRRRYRPE